MALNAMKFIKMLNRNIRKALFNSKCLPSDPEITKIPESKRLKRHLLEEVANDVAKVDFANLA